MRPRKKYFECLTCWQESVVQEAQQPKCSHCDGTTGIISPTSLSDRNRNHIVKAASGPHASRIVTVSRPGPGSDSLVATGRSRLVSS